METRFSRYTRWVSRMLFASLLIFELIAWSGLTSVVIEFTWRGLVLTLLAVWALLEIATVLLHKKGLAPLHGGVYLSVLFVLFCDAFADMRLLYGTYSWYDQWMHLAGGATAAFAGWSLFKDILEPHVHRSHRWLAPLLGFGVGVFGGAVYEIEEYAEDVLTGSHRLGNGFDTANDLLLDICGACIIFCIAYFIHKRKSHA